jgi:glycosyltransferase involved in cell wall biosynthesis
MRALLIAHRLPPDGVAGVERYTESLTAGLRNAGVDVAILTRRLAARPVQLELEREKLPNGAALYQLVGGRYHVNRFLDHYEPMEQLFRVVLAEAPPDVVHINHLLGFSPRFIAIAQRLRLPVVVSMHDFFFACPRVHLQKRSGGLCAGPDGGRECARSCFFDEAIFPAEYPGMASIPNPKSRLRWGIRTAYYRRLLGMAQRVICFSRYVGAFFESFGVSPGRLRVLPHGVQNGLAAPSASSLPTPQERGTLNLAFCGTVCDHKGVHIILDALRTAGVRSVDLRILGETPYQDYTEDLRQRAAVIPGLTLRLLGPYEQADLPALLANVDCVVQASLVPETGGLAPRDALARGIPIAVSRLGALPELVTPGVNGHVFDPAKPRELAAFLRRLWWEDGLMERLRQGAARTPVVTMSQHTAAVQEVYAEAADEMLYKGPGASGDLAEVGYLHEALVELGFCCAH